jgi:hypothetical protein
MRKLRKLIKAMEIVREELSFRTKESLRRRRLLVRDNRVELMNRDLKGLVN